jgi:hypothetical protein
MLAILALIALLQAGQPAAQNPEITTMKANLGGACSADFLVKDTDGKPVYGAIVHVRVRYGFMNVKRADLEIGTSSEGKARIEGLPDKAKPLAYDVKKDDKMATADQEVEKNCHATFELTLKKAEAGS